MSVRPPEHSPWTAAKLHSPSREPYTDEELMDLRVRYDPETYDHGIDHQEAVVIWTLLDMIERQKGWTV